MSKESGLRRLCDLMTLIRKAPRTVAEVVDLWECPDYRTVLSKFELLHEEGHIYIVGTRPNKYGRPAIEYHWQPSPFEMQDAVVPPRLRPSKRACPA